MSASYTLFAFEHPENSRCHKCLVAGAIAGLDISFKAAPLPPTAEWIKDFHPSGGSPVLDGPEGRIFETNSVLRYIARNDKTNTLYGKGAFENSRVDSWLDFSLSELDIYGFHIVNALLFGGTVPSDWLQSFEATLSGLEGALDNGRTFLVGDNMTIADICIAFVLQIPFRLSGHGEHLVERFPNIWRMYSAVMAREETVATLKNCGAGGSGLIAKKDE